MWRSDFWTDLEGWHDNAFLFCRAKYLAFSRFGALKGTAEMRLFHEREGARPYAADAKRKRPSYKRLLRAFLKRVRG